MRRNMIVIAVTAAAAFVGVLLGAQPAAAGPAAGKVTVTVKQAGVTRTATLTCAPVGGTHRSAAEACAVLTAAGGNPAAINPADLMCTMEYAPVKVKVTGRWNKKAVRYTETFSNNCRTRVEGGALFQL